MATSKLNFSNQVLVAYYNFRRNVLVPLSNLIYLLTAPIMENVGWLILAVIISVPFAFVGYSVKDAFVTHKVISQAVDAQINADAWRAVSAESGKGKAVVSVESGKGKADPFGAM